MKFYVRIGILLLILLSIGCNGDGDNPIDPPPPDTEFAPNTTLLGDSTLALISQVNDSVIVFSSANNELTSLESGDILIAKISAATPNGFIGKITSISSNSDTIKISETSLEDAFKTLKLEFSRELIPADVDSSSSLKGVAAHKATSAFNFNLFLNDVVLFDADNDENTTDDQILANGSISLNLDIECKIDISVLKLNHFVFKNTAEDNAQLNIDANINVTNLHVSKTLKTYYFAAFAVGPVVFTPKIDVRCSFDGEVSLAASVIVAQEATVTAGIEYINSAWNPISSFENSFNYEIPEFSADANMRGAVGPQLSLLLYGVVGPFAEIDAFARLEAELHPLQTWKLYGGLEAIVGAEVDILGKTIVDYQVTVIDYEELLANGTLERPLEISSDSNLFFGNFIPPSSAVDTWTLRESDGTLEKTGGTGDSQDQYPDDHYRGRLRISGSPNAEVDYSFAVIQDFADANLSLTSIGISPPSPLSLDSLGVSVIEAGGVLNIAPGAASGVHTATIEVTAKYNVTSEVVFDTILVQVEISNPFGPLTVSGIDAVAFGVLTAPTDTSVCAVWTLSVFDGLTLTSGAGDDPIALDHNRGMFRLIGDLGATVTYSVAVTTQFGDPDLTLMISNTNILPLSPGVLDPVTGVLEVQVGSVLEICTGVAKGTFNDAVITITADYIKKTSSEIVPPELLKEKKEQNLHQSNSAKGTISATVSIEDPL